MRMRSYSWDGADPRRLAAEIRGLNPPDPETRERVAAIIAEVAAGGDAAVAEISARLGDAAPDSVRVAPERIAAAAEALEPSLRGALELAAANVRAVADAQQPAESVTDLPQGQRVSIREVPVAAAAVYAPGGHGAYPSTVLMGAVPARAAGVGRVAVVTPPAADGSPPDVVLAACAVGGVDEVYAVGGAQAIAALALGTETIVPVDVIVGPGNNYVSEAKRQLYGRVGSDGIAGPSELMVVFTGADQLDLVAHDLRAQAEHGPDGLLVAAAPSEGDLAELATKLEELEAESAYGAADTAVALVAVPDTEAALRLADALAPEHLELIDEDDYDPAAVTTAGAVFLGEWGGTAFGDYVAGSNHVLPTGGAGRFQGPLSPSTFRRRISTVSFPEGGIEVLAEAGATLADSEGFPAHAESMRMRGREERRRRG